MRPSPVRALARGPPPVEPCAQPILTPLSFPPSGSGAGGPIIEIEAAVPANARATVRLPIPAAVPPASVTVSEGGAVVFAGGAFKPGTPGVYAAAVRTNDAPQGVFTIDVEVGAGVYALAATAN